MNISFKKRVHKSFARLSARGPDQSNLKYYNANLAVGFHRLAINDQSSLGMQPFELNHFVCLMNGEIYNYEKLVKEFKLEKLLVSKSDCEIVLHLFDRILFDIKDPIQALTKLCQLLDGEFAFVIYDTNRGICYFGVDELRVRPLFLYKLIDIEKSGILEYCFASEQKGLCIHKAVKSDTLKVLKCCDPRSDFLSLRLVSAYEHTVDPIKAGTVGYIDGNSVVSYKNYANLNAIKEIPSLDFEESLIKLREILTRNVALKLNFSSEREIGFLLSGGLDSSLICSIAARLLYPVQIKTFTVGFDKSAPDVIAARLVAKHINSIHTEFIFSFQDGIDILSDVIRINESWDQTTTRASIPMLLACRAIKEKYPEIAIIYSGEMADEMFMGYLEWQLAPDATEARDHVIKRLKNITYFDGLRADRIVSSVGCELRLPFFSKSMLNFVLSLPAEWLMPQTHRRIEKFMLRKAFDSSKKYLPDEILWRTKNAFSDATSLLGEMSLKESLKKYADSIITYSRFSRSRNLYIHSTPQTKEDMLYREIFDDFGYSEMCIPFKWLPNWTVGHIDSSATTLSIYK